MKRTRGVYYCETGQDDLHKNALCDRLMKEGIDGRPDVDVVARTGQLTDLAVQLGRKDGLACVLAWYEVLDQKTFRGELAISLDYIRAIAIAGKRYGTEWQWDQATLAREIFHLRRAVSHKDFPSDFPGSLQGVSASTTLATDWKVAGRAIEALDCWRRTLEIKPNFGMSLCNRAIVLANYALALEDEEEKACFLWAAHKEASAALAPTANYTDIHDEGTRRTAKKLKDWIESALDVQGIAATGVDPLAAEDTAATAEEREDRRWCLVNRLYLNPLKSILAHTPWR